MCLLKALVIVFAGSNGERDLFQGFARAGFAPEYHPYHQAVPANTAVVGLPGGFSFGDYWRAGVLASRSAAVLSLPAVVNNGGLILGVCNGFQILLAAGLLPGALQHNRPLGFVHRWLTVEVTPAATTSPWFYTTPIGTKWHLPIAHGEGNYWHAQHLSTLTPRVPLTYEQNPNGSMLQAAAVLDDTGQILGMMPHPERATDADVGGIDGLQLFKSAYHHSLTKPKPRHA